CIWVYSGLCRHLWREIDHDFPLAIIVSRRGSSSGVADEIPRLELDRAGIRIERHTDRVAPRGHRLERIAQHPPDHQDAAVARAKMLLGMDRHRPLANLGFVVAGELLVLLLRHVPQ